MLSRVIISAVLVIGLTLGAAGYAAAEEALTSLPEFTSGSVLTAEELNSIVKALETERLNIRYLITYVNVVEGQLVCNTEGSCNSDPDLSAECQEFVDQCLTTLDPAGCIGSGTFICEDEPLPEDLNEFNVCTEEKCVFSSQVRDRCQTFIDDCLEQGDWYPEECAAGGLFICNEAERGDPGPWGDPGGLGGLGGL